MKKDKFIHSKWSEWVCMCIYGRGRVSGMKFGELWEESKKSNGFIVLFARTVASPC